MQSEIVRLEQELRRSKRKIETLIAEKKNLRAQLSDAQKGAKLLSRAYRLLVLRVGLRYGEVVMDDARGVAIGRHLTLPVVDDPEGLLAEYKSTAWRDHEAQIDHIGVGLRDDPDDEKSDQEREAEAERYRKGKEA